MTLAVKVALNPNTTNQPIKVRINLPLHLLFFLSNYKHTIGASSSCKQGNPVHVFFLLMTKFQFFITPFELLWMGDIMHVQIYTFPFFYIKKYPLLPKSILFRHNTRPKVRQVSQVVFINLSFIWSNLQEKPCDCLPKLSILAKYS